MILICFIYTCSLYRHKW